MPKWPALSGRLARTLLAVVAFGVLVTSLMSMRAEVIEEEKELAFNLTGLSWKISETIFEIKRLELILQDYEAGLAVRDDLILQAELLWSRVGVLEGSELRIDASILRAIDTLSGLLTAWEHAIYDAPDFTPAQAAELRAEVAARAAEIRSLWIREFLVDREAMLRAAALSGGARYEMLAVLSVASLILYMSVELLMAGRAQARERHLRTAAMAASEAKSAFLANVSHEIRTPLNGVLGMAQELSATPLSQEQAGLVDVMVGAGQLLVSTIDDVLDISKVESGHLELEEVAFDPRRRIEHCVALHQSKAREKGVHLSLQVGADLPGAVSGDPMRLSQVLNNLVSNALKFTDAGGVRVVVAAAPPGEGGQALSMSVSDTGIGIAPETQARIFEPFTQADAGTARRAGGTGLGLTISRAICRQMGGDLTVQSRPGEGSTFVARVVLKAADGGAETDILPGEGAHDYAPSLSVPRPVVVAPDAGGDGGGDAVVNPAPDTGAGAPEVAVARLLLVDDSRTNRLVMQRFLRGRAGQVVEAVNGAEAVDAALKERFDLILMDIQMPEMDGIEATRRIRAHERETGQAATLIVAVTANVMTHQVKEYRANGIDRVISKPVRKAEILALLSDMQSLRAA